MAFSSSSYCLFLSFFLIGLLVHVDATVLYVQPGATGTGASTSSPLGSIQEAIDASANGGEIILMDGNYISNVGFDLTGKANLYIHTVSTSTIAIIQITNGDAAFRVNNAVASLTVEGLSFQNSVLAAAIVLTQTPTVTVNRCTFYNTSGSVVIPAGATGVISNSQFLSNTKAAIAVSNGNVTITNCKFISNTASAGGSAINCGGAPTVNVTSSVFVSNKNTQIFAQGGTITLTANSFFNNGATNIQCTDPAGVFQMTSDNLFCGVGIPISTISCSGSYTTPVLDEHDGCGVCKGSNSDKNCVGQCFQAPTYPRPSCPTPKTIYVALGGTGNGNSSADALPTIQQGINAAASYGDTVMVMNGNYSISSPLNFNGKQVVLTTQHGIYDYDNVTIDCATSGSAFVVNNAESFDTIVQGFKILRFSASSVTVQQSASSGISSAITLRECLFKQLTTPSNGAAISLSNSFVSVIDSIFDSNSASASGGAIYTFATSSYTSVVNVQSTVFTGNSASGSTGQGAAIVGGVGCKILVASSYFINNTGTTAGFKGGAFFIAPGGRFSITDSSFYSNGQSQTTGSGQSISCAGTSVIQANRNNYFCGVSNDVACTNFVVNTTTNVDQCHICNGNNQTLDCTGKCFGNQQLDATAGCCFDFERDCNSSCSLTHTYDSSNQCCLTSAIDVCGKCNGQNTTCINCPPSFCQHNGTCNGHNVCNCSSNYTGDSCNQPVCHQGCQNGQCIEIDTCQCDTGFNGTDCSIDLNSEDSCDGCGVLVGISLVIAIVCIVGGALLILGIVVGIILFIRRRKHKHSHGQQFELKG